MNYYEKEKEQERLESADDNRMEIDCNKSTAPGTFARPVEIFDEISNASSTSTLVCEVNKSNPVDNQDDDDDIEEISVIQNFSKKSTGCLQNMGKESNNKQSTSSSVANKNLRAGGLFDELKFMQDFDPINSSRNQQKRKKRYHPVDGRLIQYADDFDDCDCLKPNCPGCHFPCKSCGDTRCGHECRVNRKWVYESVEVEGRNEEYKNQHASSFI